MCVQIIKGIIQDGNRPLEDKNFKDFQIFLTENSSGTSLRIPPCHIALQILKDKSVKERLMYVRKTHMQDKMHNLRKLG